MKSFKLIFLLTSFFIQGVSASAVNAEDRSAASSTQVVVIFETTLGSFTLELYPEKAPKTVANFLTYVDEGFYSNTLFHRVIPGFVIQGGGFEKGMKKKQTHESVKNESDNRLKNTRGTISMARRTHPDTATSQFFINVADNSRLDWKAAFQPGYTVFGKVTDGMDVIDRIAGTPTHTVNQMRDVPKEDVIILSARREGRTAAQGAEAKADSPAEKQEDFIAGEHYAVLERPVPTRDSSKIEVVEMFSYGCPHCYEFESSIKQWSKQQASDVDFWVFPAVWNKPMALYAQAFYTARELDITEKIHQPLFTAIVIEQKNIRNENDLADFFVIHGVDKDEFTGIFNSPEVKTSVKHAEERVRLYKPVGVPEIVVNGKYRIDRMRAGGLTEMLAVADFLINKERTSLTK